MTFNGLEETIFFWRISITTLGCFDLIARGKSMFLGFSHALFQGGGRAPAFPRIVGSSCMRAHSTRNSNQILHGDKTRCEEFLHGRCWWIAPAGEMLGGRSDHVRHRRPRPSDASIGASVRSTRCRPAVVSFISDRQNISGHLCR